PFSRSARPLRHEACERGRTDPGMLRCSRFRPARFSSEVLPFSTGVYTCPSEKFFENLCAALDADWLRDSRFSTIDARLANNDALDAAINARCRCFDADELLSRLIAGDVLTAPVNTVGEVVKDPQILNNE